MSKKSIPKRHHFIPEMHQANFIRQDGKLFCFDREFPEKGIQERHPGSLFVEGHYYSLTGPNGERDVTLEIELSKFEHVAKPVILKIIKAARTENLTDISQEDIEIWIEYLYLQSKRTPDAMRQNLGDFDSQAYLSMTLDNARTLFPRHVAEIDKIDQPAERQRIIKNAMVNAVSRGSRAVFQVLRKRGLAIARITAPGKSLVLGSHPVIRMQSKDLRDPSTELWLPIAPDVAAGIGQGDDQILAVNVRDSTAVRRMNVAVASQSRVFASPSRELVRSLARHFGANLV